MLKNLKATFERVVDVRSVPDPWGSGWTFDVRRAGNPDWQAAAQRLRLNSPAMLKMVNAQLSHLAGVNGKGGKGGGLEFTREELINSRAAKAPKEEAEAIVDGLLEGWSGIEVDGEEFEFDRDNAIALLTETEWEVPLPPAEMVAEARAAELEAEKEERELTREEQMLVEAAKPLPYAGMNLGEALRAFIVDEAERRQAYYARVVEGLEGNSERSSPGDSAGGGTGRPADRTKRSRSGQKSSSKIPSSAPN